MIDLCVKTGTRFSLRDKRLFEISEFEITRVDCILKTYVSQREKMFHRIYAPNKDSDQPAVSPSLIRILTERILNSQGCNISSYGQRRLFGRKVRTYVMSRFGYNRLAPVSSDKILSAHLSTKCSWWAIVVSQFPSSVVRRPSCVVHRPSWGVYNCFKSILLLHPWVSWLDTW